MSANLYSVTTNTVRATDSDNPAKWLEVYKISGALQVMFDCWHKCPVERLEGDEFEAARKLLSFVMASSGIHLDAIQTVVTQDEMIAVHNEFMQIVRARMP